MAATLLGTTGNFGIPADESGIVIESLSLDYSVQDKPFLNKSGEITGLALWQEKYDVKLSGYVPKTGAYSGKLGAALALANAIPAHLQNSTGGATIVMGISREIAAEDFEKIDITAVHHPFVTLS
jgi:hypothetical protein